MDRASPNPGAGTRAKVFFLGLFPVIVTIVFLVVAKLAGFPFWEALTEKIDTDPEGHVMVTTVLGTEVSTHDATKTDMIVHKQGPRAFAWLGVIATLLVSGLGLTFMVTAFLPADNKLLAWVVRKVNEPPTTI